MLAKHDIMGSSPITCSIIFYGGLMNFSPINITSAGTHTVIANSPGNIITVFGMFFQCSVSSTITVKSDINALTGSMSFPAGGGFNLFWGDSNSIFQTGVGEDFIFTVTGLLPTIGGQILYVISPP